MRNYLNTDTDTISSDYSIQKLDSLIGYKITSQMDLQLLKEI